MRKLADRLAFSALFGGLWPIQQCAFIIMKQPLEGVSCFLEIDPYGSILHNVQLFSLALLRLFDDAKPCRKERAKDRNHHAATATATTRYLASLPDRFYTHSDCAVSGLVRHNAIRTMIDIYGYVSVFIHHDRLNGFHHACAVIVVRYTVSPGCLSSTLILHIALWATAAYNGLVSIYFHMRLLPFILVSAWCVSLISGSVRLSDFLLSGFYIALLLFGRIYVINGASSNNLERIFIDNGYGYKALQSNHYDVTARETGAFWMGTAGAANTNVCNHQRRIV